MLLCPKLCLRSIKCKCCHKSASFLKNKADYHFVSKLACEMRFSYFDSSLMGRTIKHCWDMRFQEFWGIASSVAYKPLLKCTQTPSAKFKIRSYVATTYLEFSGHIQVFVCVKLWSAEAGRVTTTQCLILQREILPRIISSMAHPWYNRRNRPESLTSSFELGEYSVINSHVSSKSRKILSCEPASLLETQRLQLPPHFQPCLWKSPLPVCYSHLLGSSIQVIPSQDRRTFLFLLQYPIWFFAAEVKWEAESLMQPS